jgi:hypothetical protein
MDDRILKYFLGELNESERLQLLKLIEQDESLKNEFVEMQNLFALTQLSAHPGDEEMAKQSYRIFTRRLQAKQRKLFLIKIGKIAAVALVLIISTVFARSFSPKILHEIQLYILCTYRAGQRHKSRWKTVQRMAQRQIYLKISFRFAGKERKVTLTGERTLM